jgi:hypothetical protein
MKVVVVPEKYSILFLSVWGFLRLVQEIFVQYALDGVGALLV